MNESAMGNTGMNESHKGTFVGKLLRALYSPREITMDSLGAPLESLLGQAIRRRPYLTALALISPGGKLWASALPDGVEAESVAAMAAPMALLGRRVALEQLSSDMRQTYVEGDGGYAILRAIGESAVLLTTASADANAALVLHDVDLLEGRVAQIIGVAVPDAGKWSEAATSIEHLRRLISERPLSELLGERQHSLRTKLNSLDMGFYQKRVAGIRVRLQNPRLEEIEDLEELERIEAELLELEKDVRETLKQELASATGRRHEQKSLFRRLHKWLTSMIESKD